MQTHLLKSGDFFLEVEEKGGNIVNFAHLFESNHIFFPRMKRKDGKIRGGSHVCFPYFNSIPGVEEKHGFGRHVMPFSVKNGTPDKLDLFFEKFSLHFEMIENGFKQRLVCESPQEFEHFNPAFHPYIFLPKIMGTEKREAEVIFHSPETGASSVSSDIISDKSFLSSVLKGSDISIKIKDHGEMIMRFDSSANLSENKYMFQHELCLWRDDPFFICVEPVLMASSKREADYRFVSEFWMEMEVDFFPEKNVPA